MFNSDIIYSLMQEFGFISIYLRFANAVESLIDRDLHDLASDLNSSLSIARDTYIQLGE